MGLDYPALCGTYVRLIGTGVVHVQRGIALAWFLISAMLSVFQ
jgi:hypothetical protein